MIRRWKLKLGQWAGDQILGDRETQQDDYAAQEVTTIDGERALLMVLADGMGGHKGGSEAADTAISGVLRSIENVDTLSDALIEANDEITSLKNIHDASYTDMGCTLVIALVTARGVEWVSVGDSPLWLVRNGSLIRLNRDHSMAPVLKYMAQNGEISEEDAAEDPRRNQLRSALTGGEIKLIDESEAPVPLKPGDHLLLASDGLMGLEDQEIAESVKRAGTPAAICAQLLHNLRQTVSAGLDNSSLLVYKEGKRGWL